MRCALAEAGAGAKYVSMKPPDKQYNLCVIVGKICACGLEYGPRAQGERPFSYYFV